MDLSTRRAGHVTVLDLKGRFDAHAAPGVEGALGQSEALECRLVVNLSEVTFVDSTALAVLVAGLKRCRQAGGDLRLCDLPPAVRAPFQLTRLDRAFEIFPDEAAAVASFGR